MYLEDFESINPTDERSTENFSEWVTNMDARLDIAAEIEWLMEQEDVFSMACDAKLYSIRPGLGGRRHG